MLHVAFGGSPPPVSSTKSMIRHLLAGAGAMELAVCIAAIDCSVLAAELSAESIDYLDLVFRLEEAIGRPIPISRWQHYLHRRFGNGDLAQAITTRVVLEFAQSEAEITPGH